MIGGVVCAFLRVLASGFIRLAFFYWQKSVKNAKIVLFFHKIKFWFNQFRRILMNFLDKTFKLTENKTSVKTEFACTLCVCVCVCVVLPARNQPRWRAEGPEWRCRPGSSDRDPSERRGKEKREKS